MPENNIIIKDIDKIEDMFGAFPLVQQMYKQMDFDTYKSYITEMVELSNFKMVAAFDGEKMVGVSGYFVLLMLYCGRYLQISNFVVDKHSRNKGIGRKILQYLEHKARKFNCHKFVLDSYTENKKSHPLYYSEGFYVRGFHFMKDLA
jgi:GNAT superfamily N-acetyltransferase